MKSFLILFVYAVIGFSCFIQNNNETEKNRDSGYLTKVEKDKDLSYEKVDPSLNTIGLTWKDVNGVSQIFCDTAYKNQTSAPIKLEGPNCPFQPYMLVVNDHKLLLLNKNLNLIYNLKTDFKIHNAAWSPFNKSEIFLLVKKEFKIKRNELTKYFPESLFDLILCSLNLESMQLNKITTLFDFSVRSCKLNEDPPEFFSATPFLKIDAANKLIYYDCYQPWNPDDDPYFLLTYVIDLRKKTTALSNLKEFKCNNFLGNIVDSYIDGYYKPSEIKQKEDYFLVKKTADSKPEVKIPTSILNEEPIRLAEIKDDYESIGFWIYFIQNANRIICSPGMEIGMENYIGNIYLINSKGKLLKTLIKERVVGFNLTFRKLDSGNYLFGDNYFDRGKPELYLFDKDFNLLQNFSKVQHYEVIKQDN